MATKATSPSISNNRVIGFVPQTSVAFDLEELNGTISAPLIDLPDLPDEEILLKNRKASPPLEETEVSAKRSAPTESAGQAALEKLRLRAETISSKSDMLDPTVQQVVELLEEVYTTRFHGKQRKRDLVEIELEGRIGVIEDANDRIKLPVDSETLLAPPSKEFPYRFKAGLSSIQFQSLLKRLHEVLALPGGFEEVDELEEVIKIQTEDLFYEVPEGDLVDHLPPEEFAAFKGSGADALSTTRIRVSWRHPIQSPNEPPIEIIAKEQMATLNIYTGRDVEEYSEKSNKVDLRFALNLEFKFPRLQLQRAADPTLTRQRKRYSYPIEGLYRIDATEVNSKARGAFARTQYEVEMEVNPQVLEEQLERKVNKQDHRLYEVITDFVEAMHGLAAYLNHAKKGIQLSTSGSTTTEQIPGAGVSSAGGQVSNKAFRLADVSKCGQSETALQRYLSYVSPVVPLIGDYLFNAVAPVAEKVKMPAISEEEKASAIAVRIEQATLDS